MKVQKTNSGEIKLLVSSRPRGQRTTSALNEFFAELYLVIVAVNAAAAIGSAGVFSNHKILPVIKPL